MHSSLGLRPIALSLLASSVLMGCATTTMTPGSGQRLFYGTGNNFRMNGLQMTELRAGSLPSEMTTLMVRSTSDAKSLDRLIAYYTSKASEAASEGDPEQFAVAWHISKKLSAARLEQSVSTSIFNNNLLTSKNGTAMLPGGARVFVASAPYKDMTGASKSASVSLEELGEFPNFLAAEEFDWSSGTKVAALEGITGLLNTLAGTNGQPQPSPRAPAPNVNASTIQSMAVGSAYAASDSHGNKYIVEKTSDGIFLYNPDGSSTQVDLNQLNFMPVVETPDAMRYATKPIYKNLQRALWERKSAGSGNGILVAAPPNKLLFNGQTGFVNVAGEYSPTDNSESRQAYKTNKAYRMAIDMSTLASLDNDGIYQSMRTRCSGSIWREYSGDALEYATYQCLDARNNVTYSRTYVISNSMKAQSWDSVLNDKKYQDKLKQGHEYGKIAEAAAGFLPVVGNLEGALRCSGMQSAIYTFVNSYSGRSVNSDVRKFVSYSPETETPSAMSTALDCAQGISGLGSVRMGVSKVASLAKIDGLVTSESYKTASSIMKNFDIAALSGKGSVAEAINSAGNFSSIKAGQLAQKFYDSLQQYNSVSGLADSVLGAL